MCILGVRDKLTLLTKTTSTAFPRLILAASKKPQLVYYRPL